MAASGRQRVRSDASWSALRKTNRYYVRKDAGLVRLCEAAAAATAYVQVSARKNKSGSLEWRGDFWRRRPQVKRASGGLNIQFKAGVLWGARAFVAFIQKFVDFFD